MNRIKSLLIIATLTLGIPILFLNSYTITNAPVSNDSLFSTRQLITESISDFMNEENNNSFIMSEESDVTDNTHPMNIEDSSNLYTASRGSSSRLDSKNTEPTSEVKSEKQSEKPKENKPKAQAEVKPKAQAKESAYSSNETDLLARLITAEAQLEPYDAKVAVGAVVMNRVKSSSFPNSISEVIYQNIEGYYQFTPVVNGWIDKPASSESLKATKVALSGHDPTNGALFYYDNTSSNEWILSKPVSVRFGDMIYAY